MLRFVVLVGLVVAAAAAGSESEFDSSFYGHWINFKRLYGKHYNAREDAHRQQIFRDNIFKIINHNVEADLGGHTHKLAVNRFSDLSNEEFLHQFTGYRPRQSTASLIFSSDLKDADIPDTVDWRKKNIVTPVKNQEQCGSCWAFATVASLEGQHAKATGNLVSLSEQNLVDCSKNGGNMGCNGGTMDAAFDYIKQNGGIDTEESYPYEGKDGQCRYKKENRGAGVTGHVDIKMNDEEGLHQASATVGPIAVAIDATFLQFYTSGIFDFFLCSKTNLNHGVTVVGYGAENGKNFWLVKNSWGGSWGEEGYFRLARGKNECGVATNASYPLVQ